MAEEITLYLGLKPGERADFQIVGLAAAAFAESVKEIAYILEPGIEVRLEFESGLEGSLKLKAILKTLKNPEAQRGALIGVISTVGIMLINDVRTYGVGKLLDSYLAPEQRQQLSEEDIERIANAVKGVKEGKIAKKPVREMYRQLERDKAVESVGSIAKPDAKPIRPIPRTEFPVRAGIAPLVQTSPRTRISVSKDLLTLISPVFLQTDRVWRFHSANGENSYHISDLKFLADCLAGNIKFKEGLQIVAEVQTLEEYEGGVWIPRRRTILKVRRQQKQKKQSDMFASPKRCATSSASAPTIDKSHTPLIDSTSSSRARNSLSR